MLIRTIEELEALPDGAIVRDAAGCACQKIGVSEYARGRVPEADAWERMGQPNRNLPHLPAQLIHPRRYGDEDVEKVARALCENDHDFWDIAEVREYYRPIARAALNALEGK